MNGNNILGIIFANIHDEKVRELTETPHDGERPVWRALPLD